MFIQSSSGQVGKTLLSSCEEIIKICTEYFKYPRFIVINESTSAWALFESERSFLLEKATCI